MTGLAERQRDVLSVEAGKPHGVAMLCRRIDQSLGTLGMLPHVNLLGGTDCTILNQYCIASEISGALDSYNAQKAY